MGIFLGLLPKDLILLGLPRVRYFLRLFFLSLPDVLGFPGFLLFAFRFFLMCSWAAAILALSLPQSGPARPPPRVGSLQDPPLDPNPLESIPGLRMGQTVSGIDVLGGHSSVVGVGLEEEILMLPRSPSALYPQRLIPPLFQTPPKLRMEPHWFLRFLRIRDEILEGEYCYVL